MISYDIFRHRFCNSFQQEEFINNIVIADPHEIYRAALSRFIRESEQDITVTEFCEHAPFTEYIDRNPAELILIAHDMPGFESMPPMEGNKVGLMVSGADMPPDNDVFCGIFSKTLSSKDFIFGIREILSGKNFFPSMIPVRPVIHESAPVRVIQDFGLSPREKEVLSYLAKGASNKDIARALDLQVVTIKLHVRGICRKMHASNRTQAALLAKECGWG